MNWVKFLISSETRFWWCLLPLLIKIQSFCRVLILVWISAGWGTSVFKSYPPSLCMPLFASLSDSLNTHVTEVTIIYLLSAWGRNDDHQHTHKHTCLPALAQWLTHQRLWCFFCIISSFHFNLFYVLVCLLLFSLIVSFCLSLF